MEDLIRADADVKIDVLLTSHIMTWNRITGREHRTLESNVGILSKVWL